MDSPASYVHSSLMLAGSALAATPVNWGLPRSCGKSSAAASNTGARISRSGRIAVSAARSLLRGKRPELVPVHEKQDAVRGHRRGVNGAAHVHLGDQLLLFGRFQHHDVAIF